jgi:hypothetical protein
MKTCEWKPRMFPLNETDYALLVKQDLLNSQLSSYVTNFDQIDKKLTPFNTAESNNEKDKIREHK